MRNEYRVVFTGHAGLNKAMAITRFCKHIEDAAILAHIPDAAVRLFSAEAQFNVPKVFNRPRDEQARMWGRSFSSAISGLNATSLPGAYFLSSHLTYQWHSSFFSPASWTFQRHAPQHNAHASDLITVLRNDFVPSCFITLIDDVQSVQQRVRETGHYLRLRELLSWRSVEIMVTDLVATQTIGRRLPPDFVEEYPYEGNFVVSIRQSADMLARLIFQPECPRIYASFPISRPRKMADPVMAEQTRREIDAFRALLRENFATFDPVTIDELPLARLLLSTTQNTGAVTLPASYRWLIPPEQTLCGEEVVDIDGVSIAELCDVCLPMEGPTKSELRRHTTSRDLRLIDQSDCIVVYRPTMSSAPGEQKHYQEGWSKGTAEEVRYANTRGRAIIVVRDPERDGELGTGTLGFELSPGEVVEAPRIDDDGNRHQLFQLLVSKITGATRAAVARRQAVMEALSTEGEGRS